MQPEPRVPPVQFTDIAGGSWPAVCQILAALYARDRTGAGSIIDVSMAHAWVHFLLYVYSYTHSNS